MCVLPSHPHHAPALLLTLQLLRNLPNTCLRKWTNAVSLCLGLRRRGTDVSHVDARSKPSPTLAGQADAPAQARPRGPHLLVDALHHVRPDRGVRDAPLLVQLLEELAEPVARAALEGLAAERLQRGEAASTRNSHQL